MPMVPSPSESSVCSIASNGTNAGAAPPGHPPGGGTGLLRGSALSIALSSAREIEPEWSASIWSNSTIPGRRFASMPSSSASSHPRLW